MDESIKRDILSKVDFNKEPSDVYETTKIAIRDICGDSESSSKNAVYFSKPWQQNRQKSRSRSRSWSRSSRDRTRSRERDNHREWSRGKSPRRDGDHSQRDARVTFRGRRRPTPVPGIKSEKNVFVISADYDKVFLNDEDFFKTKELQYMIIDIGSPRSLMGESEYFRLRGTISENNRKRILEHPADEKFRFGPSKIYCAAKRVEIPIKIQDKEIFAKFYIIEGNVPILVGNDILEPLGGVIDTNERFIDFKRLDRSLNLVKTSGGHFVLPVYRNVIKKSPGVPFEEVASDEVDAIVLVTLANCERDDEYWTLHDLVGHDVFFEPNVGRR